MSVEPQEPDLTRLYVEQGLSLAVIGRRFGHTADWVRGMAWRPLGCRYGLPDGNPSSPTHKSGPWGTGSASP